MNIEKKYDNIFKYALYHTNSKEEAEDITQETFLKYLEHKEYHHKGNERQILYTIARNLCIDQHRKVKHIPLDDNMIADTDIFSDVALRVAMSKLTQEEQEIIILRYVNDENISVIAKIFDTSRFTMSRRINNIVKKLENELRGDIL